MAAICGGGRRHVAKNRHARRAVVDGVERGRHARGDGLVRIAEDRRAQTGRNGGRIRGVRRSRQRRRTGRATQRMPGCRHRRRNREMRLCREGPRLRCMRRLQGGRVRKPVARGDAGRNRHLLRKCRRACARCRVAPAQRICTHPVLRICVRIRQFRHLRGAAPAIITREPGQAAGLHHFRASRDLGRSARRPLCMASGRKDQLQGNDCGWP